MRKRPLLCVKFCRKRVEWISIRNYSGFFQYFLLYYLDIYFAVQRGHLYFMHRLLPDAVCLQQVRLGVHF
jgi:hypothetical protein